MEVLCGCHLEAPPPLSGEPTTTAAPPHLHATTSPPRCNTTSFITSISSLSPSHHNHHHPHSSPSSPRDHPHHQLPPRHTKTTIEPPLYNQPHVSLWCNHSSGNPDHYPRLVGHSRYDKLQLLGRAFQFPFCLAHSCQSFYNIDIDLGTNHNLASFAWKTALVVTMKEPRLKSILSHELLVFEMFVDESHEMIVDDSLDMIIDESLIIEDKSLMKLVDETLMVKDKSLEKLVDETMMVEDKSLEKLVDETMKLDEEHFESVIADCKPSHSG
nr:hypothetical protein [Tanacetum cinerariifolium]